MFNVLPFGLSTAPYIFTKLFRPLVKLWRSRGFHPVVYLDDGLNIENSLEQAHTASHYTRGDLYAAGFIVAEEKTIWHLVQYIDWLGIPGIRLTVAFQLSRSVSENEKIDKENN